MIDQPPSTRFPTALRLAAVAVSALLLAVAYPPWDRSATAWVALGPFLAALRGLKPRAGLGLGWVWGTMAVWGIGSWVPGAFANYYQQPLWFGVAFALGASIVFAGSYAAGFAACVCLIEGRVRPATRPLVVAALWVTW
jgi:apolipoprotein N-acyltransferase